MWIKYNANPANNNTGDCVIRAISTVLGLSWVRVHDDLCYLSRDMYDVPCGNAVWSYYLYMNGFVGVDVSHSCPEECITVEEFANSHPYGEYVLSTCEYEIARDKNIIANGSHLIALISGNWWDTWNSGKEVIVKYYVS